MTNIQPRVQFVLSQELIDALAVLKERDGIPASEAVRRALRAYLVEKKILKKSK